MPLLQTTARFVFARVSQNEQSLIRGFLTQMASMGGSLAGAGAEKDGGKKRNHKKFDLSDEVSKWRCDIKKMRVLKSVNVVATAPMMLRRLHQGTLEIVDIRVRLTKKA